MRHFHDTILPSAIFIYITIIDRDSSEQRVIKSCLDNLFISSFYTVISVLPPFCFFFCSHCLSSSRRVTLSASDLFINFLLHFDYKLTNYPPSGRIYSLLYCYSSDDCPLSSVDVIFAMFFVLPLINKMKKKIKMNMIIKLDYFLSWFQVGFFEIEALLLF